ncbi:MAG TPA: carboxylesterase family protein [Bryobacteraceae bacterium]|nr:carboxylesterase family protein [Bryobacteraceae bacterium]
MIKVMKAVLLLFLCVPLSGALPDAVRIDAGLVSGVTDQATGLRVFKGIPYAAAPVGDLRWRAPKPAAAWTGTRTANDFSAACTQTPYPALSPFRDPNSERVSEDCLYLNVWTAAQSAADKRPVMVWIHGGALTRGSGATHYYDGTRFAEHGVVVVTINYRLGVFGFLAHPELTKESGRNASGNYGFLDQIAALEWVQKNIAAFGGDPGKVTIAGESAGSWSVHALVCSPLAKGLFRGAIGESGADFAGEPELAEAEKAGVRFAQSVGATTLAELRAKPADELLRRQRDTSPTVDGWFLPVQPYEIFAAGKQNDVATLIGSNADEGTAFAPAAIKMESYRQTAAARYAKRADEFLRIYPASTDAEARAASAAAIRDQVFGWEMRTWARLQTRTGKAPVFLYYFSQTPPPPLGRILGAYHASEIQYVFGTLVKTASEADRKLSEAMGAYWTNFITTGDPNGKNLLKWPAYSEKADLAMELGPQVAPMAVPHKAALDFVDAGMAEQRKK